MPYYYICHYSHNDEYYNYCRHIRKQDKYTQNACYKNVVYKVLQFANAFSTAYVVGHQVRRIILKLVPIIPWICLMPESTYYSKLSQLIWQG